MTEKQVINSFKGYANGSPLGEALKTLIFHAINTEYAPHGSNVKINTTSKTILDK